MVTLIEESLLGIIQVDNLASNINEASLFVFMKHLSRNYGSMLLLPGLIRDKNEEGCKILIENQEGPCSSVVDGNQLMILFLALVTGAGILFGYLL